MVIDSRLGTPLSGDQYAGSHFSITLPTQIQLPRGSIMRVQELSAPHGNVFNVTSTNNVVNWIEQRTTQPIVGSATTTRLWYKQAHLTPASYTNSTFVSHLASVLTSNTSLLNQVRYDWTGNYNCIGGLANGQTVVIQNTTAASQALGHFMAGFDAGTYIQDFLNVQNPEFDGNSLFSEVFGTGTIDSTTQDIVWTSGGVWRKQNSELITATVTLLGSSYKGSITSGTDNAEIKLMVNTPVTLHNFAGNWVGQNGANIVISPYSGTVQYSVFDFAGTYTQGTGTITMVAATGGYNVSHTGRGGNLGLYVQTGNILQSQTNANEYLIWNGSALELPWGTQWHPSSSNVPSITNVTHTGQSYTWTFNGSSGGTTLAQSGFTLTHSDGFVGTYNPVTQQIEYGNGDHWSGSPTTITTIDPQELATTNKFRLPSLAELKNLSSNFSNFSAAHSYCDLIGRLFGTTTFRNNYFGLGADTFKLFLMTDENVYYLHSDRLNSGDGISALGNTSLIARIPVEDAEKIHYRLQSETIITVFPAGKSLNTIDFSLRDVHGHLVDLQGKSMSLLLTFDV